MVFSDSSGCRFFSSKMKEWFAFLCITKHKLFIKARIFTAKFFFWIQSHSFWRNEKHGSYVNMVNLKCLHSFFLRPTTCTESIHIMNIWHKLHYTSVMSLKNGKNGKNWLLASTATTDIEKFPVRMVVINHE